MTASNTVLPIIFCIAAVSLASQIIWFAITGNGRCPRLITYSSVSRLFASIPSTAEEITPVPPIIKIFRPLILTSPLSKTSYTHYIRKPRKVVTKHYRVCFNLLVITKDYLDLDQLGPNHDLDL